MRSINLMQEVACPYCNKQTRVDLTDEYDVSTYDRGMGTETLYQFDATVVCEICRKDFRVAGYVSEYPTGVFNSEEIKIRQIE